MSLPRLAVRIATVAALRGQTLVGDAVHDSEIRPIDVMAGVSRQPFIVVYTDDGETQPRRGDPLSGSTSFALVLEFAIAAQMKPDPEQPAEFIVPTTDARMEVDLDRIERQIKVALRSQSSPWANVWRGLVTEIASVKAARGASAEKGVRFAGRQIEMVVSSLAEPAFGVAASGAWADFLSLLAQLDADLAAIIRAEIEGDGDSTQSRYLRRHWAQADAEALGHDLNDPPVIVGASARIDYDHPAYGEDDA